MATRRTKTEFDAEERALARASSDGSELFDDAEFSAHFEDAAARSALIRNLIVVRKRLRITQRALARRMGTTQSAVSEFEAGSTDPRLSTLQRYARGVYCQLHIRLDASELGLMADEWPRLTSQADLQLPYAFSLTRYMGGPVPEVDRFEPLEELVYSSHFGKVPSS